MAVASPPFALAYVAPIPFSFALRSRAKAQVRFYSDALGTVPIASGTGSRDVTVSTVDYIVTTDGSYSDPALDSGYKDGTQTLVGGEWAEFAFADGSRRASFACTGGANPGTAASYRVILSIPVEVL